MSLFLFLLCFCIMRDTLKVFHLRDGRVDSILDTLYNLSEEKEAFFITQKMKKLFSVKLGKSKVILIAAIILLGGTGTAYGHMSSQNNQFLFLSTARKSKYALMQKRLGNFWKIYI